MKKAKLFMMLALLVMGVSSVWGATKDYYVNYEHQFLSGGYTIIKTSYSYSGGWFDPSYSITNIQQFGSLTSTLGSGISVVGDRMIRVTYTGDQSNFESHFQSNITDYIQAKAITGYTTKVQVISNTIYITYAWTDALRKRNNGSLYTDDYGNYQLNNTVITNHEWTPSGSNFTYSDLYVKTNSTRLQNVIKLPENQCAIRLNVYNQTEVTIPQTDPQKSYKVVALQTQAMCEQRNHSLSMNPAGCNTNYSNATNDHSNGTLKTVKFAKTTNVRSIGDYAFQSCYTLETIEIPQSVEYLGEATFSQCVGLTDGLTFERTSGASFTTNIDVIRNYTFWNCRNMTKLELPDGIIIIEGQQSGSSMQYMISLAHLRLPNTVVAIGPHFLCDASSLTEVAIPASVRYIDGACFHGCENLEEVFLLGPASAIQGNFDGSDTFGSNPTLCKANVSQCVFVTTQENIRGYAEDPNGVWQLIADNKDSNCSSKVKAVKTDEDGQVVRDASGNLVYETDENGQPVYLTYADGTTVETKVGNTTVCSNGWSNALTYLPDQKVTFTPGKWVTVIFPKAYTQAQLKETFGNDVVLAKMTGFQNPDYSYVNGKRTYHLNFTEQTAAEANVPYMIKPGQKNGTENYDVTMIAATEMNENYREELTKDHALPIIASDNSEVVMYGWFKKISKMNQWEFYFKNPLVNGQYNQKCVFKRIIDPDQAPAIKAFRCYWRIWLEGEAQDAGAGAKSAFFTFVDDESSTPTGIEQVESDFSIEIGAIYDLNGRKIDLKKENLPKGMFIINGKKVLVK